MTNNPTIDGVLVPRELVDRILNRTRWHGDPLKEELRALLDADIPASVAPPVERQECITFPRDLTDEMAEAIALRANCCGGIADDVWEALVQCVEKPKFPDIEVCGSWPIQSEPRPRLSALQSTIAQLQARIAELESGRGEPVAWLAEAVGPDGTAYRRTSSTTQITMRDAKHAWGDGVVSKYEIKIHPLYTATPAPVAVVAMVEAIERARSVLAEKNYTMGTDECIAIIREIAGLEATAKLNKAPGFYDCKFEPGSRDGILASSAEWHDVAGDDEGLAQ